MRAAERNKYKLLLFADSQWSTLFTTIFNDQAPHVINQHLQIKSTQMENEFPFVSFAVW